MLTKVRLFSGTLIARLQSVERFALTSAHTLGHKGRMQMLNVNGLNFHIRLDGDPNGIPVVFSNSLGTDLRLWDRILPLLPKGLRYIRYDKRGHGLSDGSQGSFGMGDLVADVSGIMDALGVSQAVFVGLSIGGIIAQGLAAERPDLVKAMILADTAAKIGTPAMWQDRVDAVRAGGIVALSEPILERWFSKSFREDRAGELAGWRNMLTRTSAEGYIGCSLAIAETDLLESTARLKLPTLALVGDEDGATPPDLVRKTADLIAGSQFHVIPGAGHLPCVEKPEIMADHIKTFLKGL